MMIMTKACTTSATALAAALMALLVVGPASVQGQVNFDDEFTDFPGFRFTTWADMPTSMRNLAGQVGYFENTWNEVGTATLEMTSFENMNPQTRAVLEELGFQDYSWDCYMNHYLDLDWPQLEIRNMDQAALELGYTREIWAQKGDPSSFQLSWGQLSDNQKWAAATFCYFHDTWDMQSIPDMGRIPVIYPYFRFVDWSELPLSQRNLANTAGWTEDSWNNPDSSDLAYTSFADLEESARQALLEMGFYEEQYDCYINHYQGLTWELLQEWDLDSVYEQFGWTQFNYESGPEPAVWGGPWDALTDDQKDAASSICWFQELWDGLSLSDFGQDYRFPAFRFKAWDRLSAHEQYHAASVGWVKATWDVPGVADLENNPFDNFSQEDQASLRALGFYTRDMYDCYVNHYEGYGWMELDDGVQNALGTFGFAQADWDNNQYPSDYQKGWDELTEAELEAADYLCWFRETWDQAPLTSWSGAAWPTNRYWLWENLGSEEQSALAAIGYTAETWNLPGSTSLDLEYTAWEELTPTQVDTLTWYGFYESQWDCYMVHYSDFNWFLLEKSGVTEYFLAFGWNKEAWQNNDVPDLWGYKWDDLDDARREAAKALCYFKETWDDLPIDQWPAEVRSGSAFYGVEGANSNPDPDRDPDMDPAVPPVEEDDDDDGGRPGLVFVIILLLVGGVGCYCYKKRSKAASFDPTSPTKGDPNLNQLTMSESSDSPEHHTDESRPYTDVDLDSPADSLPTLT